MPKRKRDSATPADALDDLTLSIATISKELRKRKRRQRYQEQRANPTALSAFMKTVLVLLYVFGGYDVSLASSYWVNQQKKKKTNRPTLPDSEMRRHIENLFLSHTDDELSFLVDPNVTSQKHAWRRAAYYQKK